ncbi:hypothetical protein [Planosporangium flavigriseum]|uniref:hypothetical protein n=1 Tax=Planosporangium flavigriseum TaxID=373681 RepID=UPI00195224CF|nr:hypothetical protein [Planosporangium flavigriseum]
MTFFAGLSRLGASTTATLSTLEPVVTVGSAALLLVRASRTRELAPAPPAAVSRQR